MSCSSAIFCQNNSTTVTNSANIPLGTSIRRFGKNLAQNGDGIVCCGNGYYDVTGNFTIIPTAIGNVTVQIVADSAIIARARSYASTATTPVNVNVKALIRNCGCDCNTTVTFTLVEGAGTLEYGNVVIEKI